MSNQQSILVTGAGGFIGKNLLVRLGEQYEINVLSFVRGDSDEKLSEMVAIADAIVHLAGENRPKEVANFALVNTELTRTLCAAIRATGRNIPLILASSTQAEHDNPYGKSKLAAERLVEDFVVQTANSAVIYRFPGVFGKWCKPNYNSVVATFCHNIAHGLSIQINDASVVLQLAYIDDVVDELLSALGRAKPGLYRSEVNQTYSITLGQLSEQIHAFQNCRTSLISERVGKGLTRALYSTYISYLPPEQFAYDLPQHGDDRGIFVEMLKTPDCGQFSFFTVRPGITRGSHYHHSKTEKFLVLSGLARMRFRHIITGETSDITVSSDKPQVVDSIPGWVHDITNIGNSEAIIMLWANEIFDRQRPDCIPCEV
ncbi:MAG: NAD-dependent epimerase/dehydratase family protein [Sulfuritalea sp.]|nr:NAD-dependent epimerase/dehydratase family protein [Sulfuritalea sp.]